MNGLTGQKMQKIFKALVPESVNNDARNLVEYCCFRFLSRDSSDILPSLKVCNTYSQIVVSGWYRFYWALFKSVYNRNPLQQITYEALL